MSSGKDYGFWGAGRNIENKLMLSFSDLVVECKFLWDCERKWVLQLDWNVVGIVSLSFGCFVADICFISERPRIGKIFDWSIPFEKFLGVDMADMSESRIDGEEELYCYVLKHLKSRKSKVK